MKVLCNKTTKKTKSFLRWGDIPFDPLTHVVLDVTEIPNMELDKLNNTNDGIIKATQATIDDAGFNAQVDAELMQIDLASMREVRAWVASQPSAPQFLKDLEAEAVVKRATRKP